MTRVSIMNILAAQHTILIIRSCCHGNVRLNNDSKFWRCTPKPWRVIPNRVDLCGRQSVHDNKSHIRILWARDDKWIFSDTVSAPRLHSTHCLEDPVCCQSAGI